MYVPCRKNQDRLQVCDRRQQRLICCIWLIWILSGHETLEMTSVNGVWDVVKSLTWLLVRWVSRRKTFQVYISAKEAISGEADLWRFRLSKHQQRIQRKRCYSWQLGRAQFKDWQSMRWRWNSRISLQTFTTSSEWPGRGFIFEDHFQWCGAWPQNRTPNR